VPRLALGGGVRADKTEINQISRVIVTGVKSVGPCRDPKIGIYYNPEHFISFENQHTSARPPLTSNAFENGLTAI
jgi:hypothetical protein